MKIALYEITATISYGGIQTFVWGIANALARKGHIVHIYGGKGNIKDITQNVVEVFTFPYLPRTKIPDLGSRFRKFMERLSFSIFSFKPLTREHYDIIYIHKPYDLLVALLASKISRAKALFGSGGTEFFPGYKYLVKKLDYFFACSEFNASQIGQYCGIRPMVLPNCINTERFKPLDPDLGFKQKLQLTDTEKIVISACRLVGWKGIEYAIRAVGKLIEEGYHVKYLIIGDGEDKRKLQTLASNLKLENSIIFLGNINNSDLPKYYSIADIAVFPSIADETFGISIAEAMSCGVPVISTNVGGIPEVVAEGTGLLVPPKDEDSLERAMETLLSDGDLRKEFSTKGRQWIVENFSWDFIVEKFERYIGKT